MTRPALKSNSPTWASCHSVLALGCERTSLCLWLIWPSGPSWASAGELISEVTVAMTGGLGLRHLATVIHPYPTEAEAIRKVADAYNRTRLTPLVARLFNMWFRWRR